MNVHGILPNYSATVSGQEQFIKYVWFYFTNPKGNIQLTFIWV